MEYLLDVTMEYLLDGLNAADMLSFSGLSDDLLTFSLEDIKDSRLDPNKAILRRISHVEEVEVCRMILGDIERMP